MSVQQAVLLCVKRLRHPILGRKSNEHRLGPITAAVGFQALLHHTSEMGVRSEIFAQFGCVGFWHVHYHSIIEWVRRGLKDHQAPAPLLQAEPPPVLYFSIERSAKLKNKKVWFQEDDVLHDT